MQEIKIGRQTIKIKKGDYILDNGGGLQFCSGDFRTLQQVGFNSYKSLLIAEKYRAILKDLTLVQKDNLKYYYF